MFEQDENFLDTSNLTPVDNGLTYHWEGDYLIPDLKLSSVETEPLVKYGMMRRTYLKEHDKITWSILLLSEELPQHLQQIDQQANQRLEELMPKLAKAAGATEELKARDQMKWVGLMNACQAQAEEIILREIVYS